MHLAAASPSTITTQTIVRGVWESGTDIFATEALIMKNTTLYTNTMDISPATVTCTMNPGLFDNLQHNHSLSYHTMHWYL